MLATRPFLQWSVNRSLTLEKIELSFIAFFQKWNRHEHLPQGYLRPCQQTETIFDTMQGEWKNFAGFVEFND